MQTRQVVRLVLVVGALLAATVPFALAAGGPKWKVGDHVEAYDLYTNTWEKGTVQDVLDNRSSGAGFSYHVKLDHKPSGSQIDILLVREDQIRAIGGAKRKFAVGALVDVYDSSGKGKDRGTVIAVGADGRYRVHYPGCSAKFDEWVDSQSLKPAAKISASSAPIRFLVGKWLLFTPSYPVTIIRNDEILREYGTGALAPPLLIKGNGTYVWYYAYKKPPVKGKWRTDAKVPGARVGTGTEDGILIDDPSRRPWKVYRWRSPDGKQRIITRLMCFGVTNTGTRL